MSKHVLIVLTNITESDREDEFNEWYDNTHLPDVTSLRDFVAATRYRISDSQSRGVDPEHRFLSIYEVETDDPGAALEALRQAGKGMIISDALDGSHSTALLYEEITPRYLGVQSTTTAAG